MALVSSIIKRFERREKLYVNTMLQVSRAIIHASTYHDKELWIWGNLNVFQWLTFAQDYLLIWTTNFSQDHTLQDHFCSVIDEFPVWKSEPDQPTMMSWSASPEREKELKSILD